MEYDKTHFGMGFDFRIGWTFTNQFSVQYDQKSAIFFSDALDRELSDEQKNNWFDDLTGGFGFSLGGGYEFSEHWHFHGVLIFGFSSGDETHSDRTSNAVSTILTVGYLLY